MNKITLKIITLSYLLFLTACNSTIINSQFVPLSTETDKVAIYIYRPTTMANAIYSPELYVDEELKLFIKNGKNTRLTLLPGEHVFEIAPDENYSGLSKLRLDLNAGNTYYLRVDTSLQINNNSATYQPYHRSFDLVSVDAALATEQITRCCSNKEKTSDPAAEIKPVKKDAEDGFSVEKTQNPFSH